MGIRLVYGLKTLDSSYLAEFYPSRRFSEAASRLGVDYAAAIHDPDRPGLTLDLCRGHAALLRGELPDSLYLALEAEGAAVVNPAGPTAFARDKARLPSFCSGLGIQHPATVAIDPSRSDAPLPFPFVIKPRLGKMGRGVRLIRDGADWEAFTASGDSQAGEFLAQAFVQTSMGIDIRFFFASFDRSGADRATRWLRAGGAPGLHRAYAVAMRRGDGFLSNAHAGGAMEAFDAPPELCREAELAFAASGLAYGTVDFLRGGSGGSGFSLCELNANPGFEELERASGLDAASAILASALAYAEERSPAR